MSNKLTPDFFLTQESFKNWALGQNETDCRYWDTWLKENQDSLPVAMLAARILTELQSGTTMLPDEEIVAGWQKLQSRIDESENRNITSASNNSWWWKSAAAAIVFLAISWLGYFVYQPDEDSYITGFGRKKNIKLFDGTTIVLNANSQLRTKSAWKFAPAREIWLEGEAFFDVVSHPDNSVYKQFVVHTKDLDVKVVGTQFNVNTRKNATRVFLNEGKVQLALKKKLDENVINLLPGDYVDYSSTGKANKELKTNLPAAAVTSWKSGYYIFDHTPLSEVIEMVEASHGIKISVRDPALLKETVSGRVPNEDINDLVKSMTSLFNLSYTLNGSELILQEKK